jgi:L-threonylcarbamoyladenylate synthase
MSDIIKIDTLTPDPVSLKQITRVLVRGGVIGYPTETVYGLGCNATETNAVNRIYRLKQRDRGKAMIIIAADTIQIYDLVATVPETADRLIDNFWPGPLTIVFEASLELLQTDYWFSKTVAVRIPASPFCLELLKMCGFPIVSTSANRRGQSEATTLQQVIDAFGDDLDLFVDGGRTPSNKPSTVVDITQTPARILREGAISALEINTVLDIL